MGSSGNGGRVFEQYVAAAEAMSNSRKAWRQSRSRLATRCSIAARTFTGTGRLIACLDSSDFDLLMRRARLTLAHFA